MRKMICLIVSLSILTISAYASVNIILDFEDIETGTLSPNKYEGWVFEFPSENVSEVIKENNNTLFKAKGYVQAIYEDYIMDKYTFETDIKTVAPNMRIGLFVRASEEWFLHTSSNVKGGEFFESDLDTTAPGTTIGSTGICIYPCYPDNNSLRLFIKKYDNSQQKNIGNSFVDINVSSILGANGFSGGFSTIKYEDDGTSVKGYINNSHIFTIDMSNPVTYEGLKDRRGVDSQELYFKNITVKAATGNTLLTVENSMVASDYSIIAIGARNIGENVFIDNLKVNIEEKTTTAEPTNEPTQTTAATPEKTAEPNATFEPVTPDNTDKNESDFNFVPIIIAVGAIIVVAIVVIIVIKNKKVKQ